MNILRTFQTLQIGTRQSLLNLRTAGALLFLIGVLTAIPATAYAQLAYAHVQADGTIDHDSGNVTVSRPFPGDGEYCIGVAGGTVQAAVVSLDSLANVGGSVQAGVFFASVCSPFPDAHDILAVTRPHLQDGGFPGADRAFYIIITYAPVVARRAHQMSEEPTFHVQSRADDLVQYVGDLSDSSENRFPARASRRRQDAGRGLVLRAGR